MAERAAKGDEIEDRASSSCRAIARAAIIRAFNARIATRPGEAKVALRTRFIDDFNARQIAFETDIYKEVDRLSEPTLKRWLKAWKDEGEGGLTPRYGNRLGDALIDGNTELREYVVAQIAARPHISSAMLMAGLRAQFSDRRRLPSYRALQRWVKRYRAEHAPEMLALANPDAWRSRYLVAAGSRSEAIERPNQLWELDSTIADLSLVDPGTGAPKRFALIQCIDVATRRMKMLVARTSKSSGIAELLRRCILDWGVPEKIKTDNGKDYTSRGMEEVIATLGIARETCTPFEPQEKPHVERAFKTFMRSHVTLLPGFVGHNVAERKGIEARRSFAERLGEREATITASLGPDEFQQVCDAWTNDLYAHRVHKSLGRSPFAAAAAYEGKITRLVDERALAIALLAASGAKETRVVGKKGISIAGGHYTDAILGAMIGKTVRVLTDPEDLGHVYVFAAEDYFICEAVNHLRRGISRADVAARKKAIQREVTAHQNRKTREIMRRVKTDDIATKILAHAAASAANVVAPDFRGTLTHSTPALEEAGKAARANDFTMRDDTEVERKAKEEVAARLADAAAGKAPALRRPGRVLEFTMREDTEDERRRKEEVAARLKELGGLRRR